MLLFLEIIQLLVKETNNYYQQYLDTLDEESPCLDVTIQEMYCFLAIIVQMGHNTGAQQNSPVSPFTEI